jgi:hypothetical protein
MVYICNVSNFVMYTVRRPEYELNFQLVSEGLSYAVIWCYLIIVFLQSMCVHIWQKFTSEDVY